MPGQPLVCPNLEAVRLDQLTEVIVLTTSAGQHFIIVSEPTEPRTMRNNVPHFTADDEYTASAAPGHAKIAVSWSVVMARQNGRAFGKESTIAERHNVLAGGQSGMQDVPEVGRRHV